MSSPEVFAQSIEIEATPAVVEHCITDRTLMHRWLNPSLYCEPVGEWSTDLGSQTKFMIQIPVIKPTLLSTVVERRAGLVVWEFNGFFTGRDRWECQPIENGTLLLNRFEFQIPNPVVSRGFNTFARGLTKTDMQAQLNRLKRIAEEIQLDNG